MASEHGLPSREPKKRSGYRSPHRMRSHHAAHHGAEEDTPPPVLASPLVYAGEPNLITEAGELSKLIERLRSLGGFAFDTEFIGEHTYYPQLCLVQVSTPHEIALLDPLAGLDLLPFWKLLADASLEKIVHAGIQDLEPVVRHINQPPRNIFDTQIAAAFAGAPYPSSLGKLVQFIAGADLGRGLKFSQWDHRPLSVVQL